MVAAVFSPAHAQALAEDQSRTEKADPRDHLRGDAGRTGIARDKRFEDHEGR